MVAVTSLSHGKERCEPKTPKILDKNVSTATFKSSDPSNSRVRGVKIMTSRVFPIFPASIKAFWVILVIIISLIVFCVFFGFIAYSARNVKFEVNEQGLHIKGGIYGRFIPKDSLIKENVRILNLNIEREYRPRLRTNGIGLPGYSEGWFRLENGEKALLFVTDRSNIVYIPTKEGYSVLLSTGQPEELLKAMDELWND